MTVTLQQDHGAEDLAQALLTAPVPADPWPLYSRLRELGGAVRAGDIVVATSYEAVSQILRNGSVFGQGPPERNRTRALPRYSRSRFLQATGGAAVSIDPPEHTRMRRVLTKALTPRAIAEMEPFVRKAVDDLIDAMVTSRSVDLKTDFAGKLPIAVVGQLVGFPEEDHDRLAQWGHVIEHASTPLVPDDELAAADDATRELQEYTDGLYADRLAHPRSDVVTALVRATEDDGMTRDEFANQVLALVVAGTQTTAHLITSALVGFAEHPDQLERFRADRTVDERAIEEFLRYYPPLHSGFPRLVLEETELGGLQLDRWETVLPFVAAANRDADVFERGEDLLIDRDPSGAAQLAFGHGAHLCVGRALARLEGCIAIRTLLDRCPDMVIDLVHVEPWATAMARGHAHVPAQLF